MRPAPSIPSLSSAYAAYGGGQYDALEKANITNGYVFGPGGMVELDADGRPNGIFREQAPRSMTT